MTRPPPTTTVAARVSGPAWRGGRHGGAGRRQARRRGRRGQTRPRRRRSAESASSIGRRPRGRHGRRGTRRPHGRVRQLRPPLAPAAAAAPRGPHGLRAGRRSAAANSAALWKRSAGSLLSAFIAAAAVSLRHVRRQRARVRRRRGDMLHRDGDVAVAAKRQRASEHLEQDDAGAVHVRALVGRPALRLLRRKVRGRAHHHPAARERGGTDARRCRSRRP